MQSTGSNEKRGVAGRRRNGSYRRRRQSEPPCGAWVWPACF